MSTPPHLLRILNLLRRSRPVLISKTAFSPKLPHCRMLTVDRLFTSSATNATDTKERVNSSAPDIGLSLSPSCIKRLHQITSSDEPYLRITISGGGCSGFQYGFEMDSVVGPDDKLIEDEKGRALVVVDSTSLSYITGSTLDYYEELIRNGFRVVSNPQADGGCSCGASFSIKM